MFLSKINSRSCSEPFEVSGVPVFEANYGAGDRSSENTHYLNDEDNPPVPKGDLGTNTDGRRDCRTGSLKAPEHDRSVCTGGECKRFIHGSLRLRRL